MVALQHFNCLACPLEDGKKLTPHPRKTEATWFKQQICHFFSITEKNQDRALNLIAQKIRIARKSIHPTRTRAARQIETRRRSLKSKGPLSFLKAIAKGSLKRCSCGRYGYGLLCSHCKSAASNPNPAQLFKPSISLVNGLGMIAPFKGNIQSSSFSMALVPTSYTPDASSLFARAPLHHQPRKVDGDLQFGEVYPILYERELKKLQNCSYSFVYYGTIANADRREVNLKQKSVNS